MAVPSGSLYDVNGAILYRLEMDNILRVLIKSSPLDPIYKDVMEVTRLHRGLRQTDTHIQALNKYKTCWSVDRSVTANAGFANYLVVVGGLEEMRNSNIAAKIAQSKPKDKVDFRRAAIEELGSLERKVSGTKRAPMRGWVVD